MEDALVGWGAAGAFKDEAAGGTHSAEQKSWTLQPRCCAR